MFKWLFSRKKKRTVGTSTTFIEATGGPWSEGPDVMTGDGGEHADYVGTMLERARQHALEHEIPVGEEFEFTLTNIPNGISSPHEIIFGLMTRASDYDLRPGRMNDETIRFTRLK